MGRIASTKRNIIWGFLFRALSLLGPFVIRSLIIWRLGVDYLGLSSFLASLLQVLNLAELGFSSAVAYGMYKPLAEGDKLQAVRYLHYLKRAYRVVGLALILLACVLLPVLGILVNNTQPNDTNLQLAFLIYLTNTVLGYFMYAYKQTLLIALQRKDVVDKIGALVLILQYLLQGIVLIAIPNFYTYALVMLLCTAVGNVVLARMADFYFPQFVLHKEQDISLNTDERCTMRRHIVGLALQKACIVSRDSFASVVVTFFTGLATVALFGNYLVVVIGILGLLGIFGTSMTASVGNKVALQSPEQNFADLRLFMFLYAMLSIIVAACLLVLYQPFMQIWMGSDQLLPFDMAVLFTVYYYVRTMGDMRTVYVNATGIWWDIKWRAVAEIASNVVLCVVLVHAFGMRGALVSLIVNLFLFNFLYGSHLIFKLYFGKEKAKHYYFDHVQYLVVGLVVCVLVFCLAQLLPSGGIVSLILKGFVALIVSAALLCLVFLRTARTRSAIVFLGRALPMQKHRSRDNT